MQRGKAAWLKSKNFHDNKYLNNINIEKIENNYNKKIIMNIITTTRTIIIIIIKKIDNNNNFKTFPDPQAVHFNI